MAKKISIDELQEQINALPMSQILQMLDTYAKTSGKNVSAARKHLITEDLQAHLLANNINTTCPNCLGTKFSKYGSNGDVKRFKCKDCGKTFTLFTGTILEKTKFPWDVWVEMVHAVLDGDNMASIKQTLEDDFGLLGINSKTIFHWIHKIIHAMAELPTPILTGIVEVDETFFRESQKGSHKLISTVKGEERYARHGRQPSKYGPMGNEFANVVVAVSSEGYCVSKVIGLGKCTAKTFYSLFHKHFKDLDFICSDGNRIYQDYCQREEIPQYVRPSKYLDTIYKAGYVTPVGDKEQKKIIKARNDEILEEIYNANDEENNSDYILGLGDLSYKEFSTIKYGAKLGLGRVNQFHGELKGYINVDKKGVPTKYLQDYVGLYTYLKNWSVSEGHYPASYKDAERILIDILKGKTNYKYSDLKKAHMPSCKSSGKYMALLKAHTEEMQRVTNNPHAKFDEEDNVVSFNKREYLLDLPDYKLKKLCSKYKIPSGWTRYPKVSELLKQPTILEDILLLIDEDKKNKISKEDLEAIEAQQYVIEAQEKKAKKADP